MDCAIHQQRHTETRCDQGVPSQAEGYNRMSSQNIYLPCYTVESAPASCLTALNEKAMFWFISRYARWCQRRR